MERPAQAVILCGGLGERLRPLTEDLPKPLAPVGGRPFLEYLICQLREQQVERVVLLTGYYGEKIRDHFGDGAGHGVQIDYSPGPAEWDTGRRIWEARMMLDCRFLLLYSDNYVPVNIAEITISAFGIFECCNTFFFIKNRMVTFDSMVMGALRSTIRHGRHSVSITLKSDT